MDEILERFIGSGFSEFGGLTAQASIPVHQYIFNEFIEVALLDHKNITSCRVTIGLDNQLSVELRTPLWFLPIHLKMQVEEHVDCRHSPTIKIWLENLGLLGKLGSFFGALPAGIRIHGEQVLVDLRAFVPQEYNHLLELLQAMSIRTEPGKMIFDVSLRVTDE